MSPRFNFKNIVMLSSLILFGCTSAPPIQVKHPSIPDTPQGVFANVALQKIFTGYVS